MSKDNKEKNKRKPMPVFLEILAPVIAGMLIIGASWGVRIAVNGNAITDTEASQKDISEVTADTAVTEKSEKAATEKTEITSAEKAETAAAKDERETAAAQAKSDETMPEAEYSNSNTPASSPESESTGTETREYTEPETAATQETQHEHEWLALTETVHHDAVTHEEPTYTTVHHEAVTEQRDIVEYHSVCDQCGAIIDSWTNEEISAHMKVHALAGEGSGWSDRAIVTGEETVVIQEAWDEQIQTGTTTVIDQEAWDETVITGYICSICGATR